MTSGPTLIVKPAGCTLPLKLRTRRAGNVLDAIFWSDGKCEAPMIGDDPWLRKHPTENVLFQIGDWDLLDTVKDDGDFWSGRWWKDLPYAANPSERDYLAALASGIANTEDKIRDLRIRLWWAGNDPIRESATGTLPPHHIDNLARLVRLLSDSDPQQRLIKAEVFRELGFFEDSKKLLEGEFPEALQVSADYLKPLVHRRDPRVARFP